MAPDHRFSITEFPNGKIQTLIADGTHWVTVSTANSMVGRARADEREKVWGETFLPEVHVARIRREALADLRARVEGLRHEDECDVSRGRERPETGMAECNCLRAAVLALLDEAQP